MNTEKVAGKPAKLPGSELRDWVQCIISAIVVCVLVFVFVGRLVDVVGSSMVPTLHEGEMVVISNLFYEPKYGDIVVLRKETYSEQCIIKRVIATEGQTVDIDFDEGIVYIDGEPLSEPYTAEPTYEREEFEGEVTVPEGCVFVMGDNRNKSTDSRTSSIGFVDKRYIVGKAYWVLFPIKNFGSVYR